MPADLDTLIESAVTDAIAAGEGKIIGRLVREALEKAGFALDRPKDPKQEAVEPPQYMLRLSTEEVRKRHPTFDINEAKGGPPTPGVVRRGLANRPVQDMNEAEMRVEMARISALWDDLRSDDEAGCGGSPGEWMVERMDEIAQRMQTEFGVKL